MERNRKGRYTLGLLLLSLCALVALIGMSASRRGDKDAPELTRLHRERQEELAAREPADIDDLESSVEQAARRVRDEDWSNAEAAARQVKQRWLSFKPAMRANAGQKMWRTSDMDDFEVALDALGEHVKARDRTRALESTDTLLKIIDNYNDNREGPPNAPRGNSPIETPSTP